MEFLSFPGLGIGPFHVNPVAFKLFGHPVMWYGVIICVGMILAFFYALSRAKFEGIKEDDMVDLTIFLIIFGVIGARLYYVLFTLDSFIVKGDFLKTLGNIVSIWNGGLAIYGGVIAGVITLYIVAKYKKIRAATLLDVVAPGLLIGQLVGRWGNFMNAEAYGSETTLPWRMGILKTFDEGATFYSETYVHPTFLYESLWNLVGFILIAIFYKKKKFNGQIFVFYMMWYGFGRMLIEGLRTDSLMLGDIRISQLVGLVTFVVGTVIMIVGLSRAKKYNKLHTAECSEEPCSATEEASEENADAETLEEAEETIENTSESSGEE